MNCIPVIKAFTFAAVIFLCAAMLPVQAQLQANFTADRSSGCSPLNVRFTNTTTGASAAATWGWTFGNTNTSALRDPGAAYFMPQAYTVTLTVRDGADISTKSLIITVYKNPAVDFTVSPARGCVPLIVNFTAAASAGDGNISNYFWDFGDGGSVQGNSYSTASHQYIHAQTPPITLNVTNSFGCHTTLTKNNEVEVVDSVAASFAPSTLILCHTGQSVSFSNASTGSGTLTYKWDFGDSSPFSTDQYLTHVYTTSGSFVTTLTVTSSDGCAATVRGASINVANFKADFTVPAKICQGQNATFINTSTQPYDMVEWYVDNSLYTYNYNGISLSPVGTHTIRLVAHYGNCTVDTIKTVTVNPTPALTGFVVQLQGACGVPVTINFKDTTRGVVDWEWKKNAGTTVFGTAQNVSNTYTSGAYDYVYLTVKNIEGCSATVSKYVDYDKRLVFIYPSGGNNQGCTGLTLTFAANIDTSISSFQWNFGDASPVSTVAHPVHSFNVAGNYTITLNYVTNSGCTGTVYYNGVYVVDKPFFNFKATPDTIVCGNNPVTFTATPPTSGWIYYWSFNDTTDYQNYYGGTLIKKFNWDTTYTVQMIAANGACRDTVTKINYIKVLPPFPKIDMFINTCDGTRGDVRFTESSIKALQWRWDFGDGATDNYTVFKDTIRHTYAATGSYKVMLSATNGGCTVKDSITTYVLLKQRPVLASTQNSACGSDDVNFRLSGYELNPSPFYSGYSYYLSNMEYSDFTTCYATLSSSNYYFPTELAGTLLSLAPGKNGLRMITTSSYFSCQDTSNFIPMRVHGPAAGFKVEPHTGCFKDPVFFTDTSSTFANIAIVKWEWDFGDNRTQTSTTNGSTAHLYNAPGYYYVRLKITDADGCTNTTAYSLHYIAIGGPKADFSASSFTVPVNTTVNFFNTSAFYSSYPYYPYCSLKWIFSDGTIANIENPSFYFTQQGNYTVTLITYNLQTGCTDTIQKTIAVRKVNSAFTFVLSYINNNTCPPVIATFTSISTNSVRVSWDFGDGAVAGNQRIVSHTYNNPGIYRVVHYSFDSNNAADSTEDYIEVKGPYALLKADNLYACNTLQVRLTADVKNASDYTWDFGDGTVVPTTDTFAVHNYLTPGIYVPALILRDAGGCTATSLLPNQVIVDSLAASFTLSPAIICDSAFSTFLPQVTSLCNAVLQSPLQYTWVTNQLTVADTSYTATANHFFNKIGTHTVSLTVQSPFGCQQTIRKTILVKQGVSAGITGVDKLCQGSNASFAGTGIPANAPLQWQWNFGNGSLATIQNPPAQTYSSTGLRQVSLIVSNGGCADTAYHSVMINPNPVVGFSPAAPFVCFGSSTNIAASGGSIYQWSSTGVLLNAATAVATVSPATNTLYFVKITDTAGCSSQGSVLVKVVQPVHVVVPPLLIACQGSPVQLTVSGADKYKWINNTAGISNSNTGNPSATPAMSVTYTVVGYDDHNCFTDTANVQVRVSILPIVNAGADKELAAGTAITLAATVSGASNWAWSPPDYLNCTTCLNPESKPRATTTYTLAAYNADGCVAKDAVTLQLLCKNDLVFIPKAFSPNGDTKNERFTINGSGIKSIRSIVIYNRWGKVVFERKNISINDPGNSWDGTYNGEPMPAAAYVYWINTVCDGGEVFNFKGSVIIVR